MSGVPYVPILPMWPGAYALPPSPQTLFARGEEIIARIDRWMALRTLAVLRWWADRKLSRLADQLEQVSDSVEAALKPTLPKPEQPASRAQREANLAAMYHDAGYIRSALLVSFTATGDPIVPFI